VNEGVNFAPRGQISPLGSKFTPRSEIHPWGPGVKLRMALRAPHKQTNKQTNNKQTTNKQQTNNKQTTNKQQTNNKQTNKPLHSKYNYIYICLKIYLRSETKFFRGY
jgi:hypothetical protein